MKDPQAATVHRLRTKPERIARAEGERLRQMVLALDLPERPASQIVAAIDRQIAAENGWTFAMISPAANQAVILHLSKTSSRPVVALRLWGALFTFLRHDTAEIAASRQELAKAAEITVNDVSRVMAELAEINAVLRQREGRGYRYFLNPNVGTCLAGAQREAAQRAAGPPLKGPKYRKSAPAPA